MYLVGFATMLGNDEEWVVEFTVGAWKPVKNRIKRHLGIPVQEQPSGVVGLPPSPEKAPLGDPYPFKTLVSRYDLGSFQQMVVLAARDDIAVYFPPETHSKVLAVYVYMRRAMHEIAQGVGIRDYQTFNARLIQTLQRLQSLFDPAHLTATPDPKDAEREERTTQLGLFPPESPSAPVHNPFEDFIEQLFADDDSEGDDSPRDPGVFPG
jgi:hypothetical protein